MKIGEMEDCVCDFGILLLILQERNTQVMIDLSFGFNNYLNINTILSRRVFLHQKKYRNLQGNCQIRKLDKLILQS